MNQATEIVKTSEERVSCDGGTAALGHPMIYLEFGPDDTELVCPYCNKKFILEK